MCDATEFYYPISQLLATACLMHLNFIPVTRYIEVGMLPGMELVCAHTDSVTTRVVSAGLHRYTDKGCRLHTFFGVRSTLFLTG